MIGSLVMQQTLYSQQNSWYWNEWRRRINMERLYACELCENMFPDSMLYDGVCDECSMSEDLLLNDPWNSEPEYYDSYFMSEGYDDDYVAELLEEDDEWS